MSLPRAPALLIGVVLLIAAAFARAEPAAADPADGALSLRDALAAALRSNPALRGFPYALKAQDGRIIQAGLRPNPELLFTAENVGGTGAVRGFTATEFTLSLSQAIELGARRERRIDAASAEREVVAAEQATRQLDVLAEVVRRYIETAADAGRLALSVDASRLAQATLTAVNQRVHAAKSPLAEGARAQIALARARLEEAQAQRRLDAERQRLAALWGDEAPRFTRVSADLYALPATADFAALAERVQHNPELTQFLSEARLRDAELRLATAKRSGDLVLGAGVRRLQAGGDEALVFSAAIPLPWHDRNQGGIIEARALRERVELDRDAAALRLKSELYGLYQDLQQARSEAEALANDLLPQAEAALKQTEYAYQRGRYSYLEWADAQRELLALRRSRLDACADYHRLLAEIERLTGEPLAQAAVPAP